MPTPEEIKKAIEQNVQELIAAKYSLPPKQFEVEERAVKQTTQKLLHAFNQPPGQKSLLPEIDIGSIEDMTKRGQLTLVAKSMDDSFLRTMEGVVSKSQVVFSVFSNDKPPHRETQKISDLYNVCKLKLIQEKGNPNPAFHDIILRMYTESTPFFKKLNAILGGYNDPKDTTNEERKLAFLFNIAVHKAGLDKRKIEQQETPELLVRGQSFGLQAIKAKFEETQRLQASGQLKTLTPSELAKINIADVAAKKALSTTTNPGVAVKFATKGGLVLHIRNPEELADFYNVANISAFAKESELITRMPDDIAMIPVAIKYDSSTGVSHVEVVCIRSQNVILNNSIKYEEMALLAKIAIQEGLHDPSDPLTPEQKAVLAELDGIINRTQGELSPQNRQDQEKFLKDFTVTMSKLYEPYPNARQRQIFDKIKSKFEGLTSAFSDLMVVHASHDLSEKLKAYQVKLANYINGIRVWHKDLDSSKKRLLLAVDSQLKTIMNPSSDSAAIQNAANNIIREIDADDNLSGAFRHLKERMQDVLHLYKEIDAIQNPARDIMIRFKSEMTTDRAEASTLEGQKVEKGGARL